MKISIIIPTLNEAKHITGCIDRLRTGDPGAEIIVVDGGSTDETVQLATKAGAIVYQSAKKSRPAQMNLGAANAAHDLLYFVHADALPPVTYASAIQVAIKEGYTTGRFRFRFDSPKLMLKINSWFTRFDKLWVSGGDETLFITKALFDKLGGYDEAFIIMEEYDLVIRARKEARYKVIQKDVLVSARKYDHNSWLKVQRANLKAFQLFKEGAEPALIRQTYYKMLHHPKDLK